MNQTQTLQCFQTQCPKTFSFLKFQWGDEAGCDKQIFSFLTYIGRLQCGSQVDDWGVALHISGVVCSGKSSLLRIITNFFDPKSVFWKQGSDEYLITCLYGRSVESFEESFEWLEERKDVFTATSPGLTKNDVSGCYQRKRRSIICYEEFGLKGLSPFFKSLISGSKICVNVRNEKPRIIIPNEGVIFVGNEKVDNRRLVNFHFGKEVIPDREFVEQMQNETNALNYLSGMAYASHF